MGLLSYAALFQKRLSLPFLAGLFVPDRYLPNGAPSPSRVEIAADMVRRVNAVLKQAFVLVAGDAFARRSHICTCISEGGTLISRVEKNDVLY